MGAARVAHAIAPVPGRFDRRPTLDTVARSLGVSRTTVSNAYNKPDQLSDQTREAVLSAARRLGYAGPSAVGRSLRRGVSGVVGALLTERLDYAFADPGMLAFLHGLAVELGHERRSLQLIPNEGSDERRTVELVGSAIVDAFIVNGVAADDAAVAAVLDRRLPLVCVGSPRLEGVPCVTVDNVAAARASAEAVIALGHTRIGTIAYRAGSEAAPGQGDPAPGAGERAARSAHQSFHDRELGYRRAAAAAGIDAQLSHGVAYANSRAGGRDAALGLLRVAPRLRPTALLTGTDVMALGAIDAARELGLRVPGDVSIVGFDDIDEGRRSVPSLTTVDQGIFEQGRAAARVALSLIAGEPAAIPSLPTYVVARASTGPPPSRPRSVS